MNTTNDLTVAMEHLVGFTEIEIETTPKTVAALLAVEDFITEYRSKLLNRDLDPQEVKDAYLCLKTLRDGVSNVQTYKLLNPLLDITENTLKELETMKRNETEIDDNQKSSTTGRIRSRKSYQNSDDKDERENEKELKKDLKKTLFNSIPAYNDEKKIGVIKLFILKMERYFKVAGIQDEVMKLDFAMAKMGKDHLTILESKIESNFIADWEEWKVWMNRDPQVVASKIQAMKELTKLKQYDLKISVDTLWKKVHELGTYLSPSETKEEELCRHFLNALDKKIANHVDEAYREFLRHHPEDDGCNSDELYNLATKFERIEKIDYSSSGKLTMLRPRTSESNTQGTDTAKVNAIKLPERYRSGPLDEEGKKFCRDNNFCTFCRAPGHSIAECNHKDKKPLYSQRAERQVPTNSIDETNSIPVLGLSKVNSVELVRESTNKEEVLNYNIEFEAPMKHDNIDPFCLLSEIDSDLDTIDLEHNKNPVDMNLNLSDVTIKAPDTSDIKVEWDDGVGASSLPSRGIEQNTSKSLYPPEKDIIDPEITEEIPTWSKEEKVFEGLLGKEEIPITFLDDGGSMGLLISRKLVEKMRWKTIPAERSVHIGLAQSGSSTISNQVCRKRLKVGTWIRTLDFAVVDTDYDVILGLPIHQKIKVVHEEWNDNRKIKRFITNNGRLHTWYGINDKRSNNSRPVYLCNIHELNNQDNIFEVKITPQGSVFDGDEFDWINFKVNSANQRNDLEKHGEAPKQDINEFKRALDPRILELVEKYPKMFLDPPHVDKIPKRNEDMEIKFKEGTKVHTRPLGRLSSFEKESLKATLTEMTDKGKIRISKSEYGSSVLFVKKKDGGLRMVIDYRSINQATIKDRTPLVSHTEMRDRVIGCKYMSKLDVRDAFHSILINEEDRHKTAFKTEFGLFEFTVCPFGLANSPATFIKLMNRVFKDMEGLMYYVDDIVIYSKSLEEHLKSIEEVFNRLCDNNLHVKLSKCEFLKSEVEFCGVLLSSEGVKITDTQKEAMCDYPQIGSYKEIQQFMGSVRFFADFIPWIAEIAKPLYELIKKDVVKNFKFSDVWNNEHQMVVRVIQYYLTSSAALALFDPELETYIRTDASNFAIGGWLYQIDKEGTQRIVCYWSRSMIPAERNYPVHEQEFLALVKMVDKFRHYLFGRNFIAITDHKSLEHIFTQPNLSKRQIRWILELQEFDFEIKYQTGESNTFADWLSRRPDFAEIKCFDCGKKVCSAKMINLEELEKDIKQHQSNDPFCYQLDEWLADSKSIPSHKKGYFKSFSKDDEGIWWYKGCGIVMSDRTHIESLLSLLHNDQVGHHGFKKTLEKVKKIGYWTTILEDVQSYCASCDKCQMFNQRLVTEGLLHWLEVPDSRGVSLGIDFVKMPLDKSGFERGLMIVDRFTKFIKVVPVSMNITAHEIAKVIYQEWYLEGYGWPSSIVSDRDPTLTSEVWKEFCSILGIEKMMSTSRHQQTDGQSEASIKILEVGLAKACNHKRDDWVLKLKEVTFAYNNSISRATGFTPFYLMFGYDHQLFPIIEKKDEKSTMGVQLSRYLKDLELAHFNIEKSHSIAENHYNKNRKSATEYKVGDKVLLNRDGIKWTTDQNNRQKLLQQWFGPFTIQVIDKEFGNMTLELPVHMRIHPTFHVSKLKPYLCPNDLFKNRVILDYPVPEIDEEGDEIFEVEQILDKRVVGKKKKRVEYLLRWKGYDTSHDTWEPMEMLEGSQELIDEFEKKLKKPTRSTVSSILDLGGVLRSCVGRVRFEEDA